MAQQKKVDYHVSDLFFYWLNQRQSSFVRSCSQMNHRQEVASAIGNSITVGMNNSTANGMRVTLCQMVQSTLIFSTLLQDINQLIINVYNKSIKVYEI
ncbi:CLUMA_CG010825, isoform A [Clunio marinus]|uniref:CLUMA_CG010825, isoform A n=1 Tax=Clunio marinus TaxID=568069 RepID=A0A1J1ID03_9DIPT|nr:CLUMA_CG010825, isoform A [Clunio marinus]